MLYDLLFSDEINASPVFSHAEVQQLRKFFSDSIAELERCAAFEREAAQHWKSLGRKEYASLSWEDYYKIRAKIKKLAALQTKLKSFDVLY